MRIQILIFTILLVFNASNIFSQVDKFNFEEVMPIILGTTSTFVPSYNYTDSTKIELVYTKIADGLYCGYTDQFKGEFRRMLLSSHMEDWTIYEIDIMARENLRKLLAENGSFQFLETKYGCNQISTGRHNIDAELILMPQIWERIVQKLGERIIFAVPHRDHNLFISAEDEKRLKGLKKNIKIIEHSPYTHITDQLFIYEYGIINKWEE